MSESSPDDELLLDAAFLLCLDPPSWVPCLVLIAERLGCGFLNSELVCGNRSALRVDSNGWVK